MALSTAIPVLTYHSNNVFDNSYQGNDHLALREDLELIASLGYRTVPLLSVVNWVKGKEPELDPARSVAITFDDGSWFDYYDIDHPSCGLQTSFFNILKAASTSRSPACGPLHASSFVIASPEARDVLDQRGLVGKGWWTDEWWPEAQQSGLLSIESHSWDHVHPDLDHVQQAENIKNDFSAVRSFEDCEAQVAESARYIRQVAGPGAATLFAYPWGQASDYLSGEYFPRYGRTHGYRAAFTADPRPVQRSDDEWLLPRFICGRDWRSPSELAAILEHRG